MKFGKMRGPRLTVDFDKFRDAGHDDRDYSPLPRITWRSAIMGILVSMGGLM